MCTISAISLLNVAKILLLSFFFLSSSCRNFCRCCCAKSPAHRCDTQYQLFSPNRSARLHQESQTRRRSTPLDVLHPFVVVVVVVVVVVDDDGGRGDTLLFVAARILSCTTEFNGRVRVQIEI